MGIVNWQSGVSDKKIPANKGACSLVLYLAQAILISAVLLSFSGGVVGDIDPRDIITQVRSRIEKTEDMSCHFRQNFFWKVLNNNQGFEGEFFLKGSKKFRVELADQTILSDGETVWTYVPANKQVLVSSYSGESENISPPIILMKYEKRYDVSYKGEVAIGDAQSHLLEFSAKTKDEDYILIRTWIDRKLALPIKVEQVDEDGNVRTFTLSDYRLDSGLADSLFVFHTPENVEEIDLREDPK